MPQNTFDSLPHDTAIVICIDPQRDGCFGQLCSSPLSSTIFAAISPSQLVDQSPKRLSA
jgi:hypothetical protein